MSGEGADLTAGRVGRPHGLDGSFYVTRALPRLLTLGASVDVGGRSAEIVRRAGTEQRPIVRLQGVDGRAAAEALRGQPLTVHAAQAPRLSEDEWWAHELEGCEVRASGRSLGTVARLIELPSCETLEVRSGADARAAPLLVPMVRDAIRKIDVSAGVIEVDADFLDLPGQGDEGVAAAERRDRPAEGPDRAAEGKGERDADGA